MKRHNHLYLYIGIICVVILYSNASCEGKSPKSNKLKTKKYSDASAEAKDTNHNVVVSLMQNVLCRNFPDIPCEVVLRDNKLRKLIEKSVMRIKNKRTPAARRGADHVRKAAPHPTVTNEDLENYLDLKHVDLYDALTKHKAVQTYEDDNSKTPIKKRRVGEELEYDANATVPAGTQRVPVNKRKLTKFFPHKIKYEQIPSAPGYAGRRGAAEEGRWKIDYARHGDRGPGGPGLLSGDALDNALPKVHSDVYIKSRNMLRKTLDSYSFNI